MHLFSTYRGLTVWESHWRIFLSYIISLGIVTVLLLLHRFVYRLFVDISWAIESALSIGILFSSGIWILLMPVIYGGLKWASLTKLSKLHFVQAHVIIAVAISIIQSYLFFYLHQLFWPEALDPEVALSLPYLFQDFRLNFFIYWILIAGVHWFTPTSLRKQEKKLKFRSNKGYQWLSFDNIRLIQAKGNYLVISEILKNRNSNEKNHIIRHTMKEVSKQLNPEFFRVHRSYIVNRSYVEKYSLGTHGEIIITLDTQKEIPTSRTQKREILNWLDRTE